MTFIGMLLSRVDPFAIYAAERELAAHGVRVPREKLTAQYLIQGQLRTVVAKLIAMPSASNPDAAFVAALIEGPDESANPRFASPAKTAVLLSATVLVAIAILGTIDLTRMGAGMNQIRWDWLVGACAVLIAICVAYAFLGARIGRVKANRFVTLVVALAFVAGVYWFTRYLNGRLR